MLAKDVNSIYKKRLKSVYMMLTYRCNLKCNMCDIWMQEGNELTGNFINESLTKLRSLGARDICFTGGEPLLRDDFFDIFKYTYRLGYHIYLSTNGSLVDKDAAKLISRYADCISVSLEGTEECHNIIRGEGTFDFAIKAIKLLKRYRGLINLNMVVSKISYKYMKNLIDLAIDLKVKSITFQPFSTRLVHTRKENHSKYIVPDTEINELQNVIEEVIRYASSKNLKLFSQDIIRLIPKHFKFGQELKPSQGCFAPFITFVILPDGDILPCPGWGLKVGNIKEGDIESIWYGDRFEEARKMAIEKRCDDCFCFLSDYGLDRAEKEMVEEKEDKRCGRIIIKNLSFLLNEQYHLLRMGGLGHLRRVLRRKIFSKILNLH